MNEPIVEPISYEDASAAVKAVYDDILETLSLIHI